MSKTKKTSKPAAAKSASKSEPSTLASLKKKYPGPDFYVEETEEGFSVRQSSDHREIHSAKH